MDKKKRDYWIAFGIRFVILGIAAWIGGSVLTGFLASVLFPGM